jgi:AraC-like DNA-binding protein
MSDPSSLGVLYTEHSGLTAKTPVASLWSYEAVPRGRDRRPVAANADGSSEYWLDRSDPLLNTILPGTGVSLLVNCGDLWASGQSLAASELLPRVSVVGPVTRARLLRLGRSVHAVGACFVATLAPGVFGVPASALVDRIVPLEDLWLREDVERLFESLSRLDGRRSAAVLKAALMARAKGPNSLETVGETAYRQIQRRSGRVSIDALARSHGLSRQQFAGRFSAAAGLPPKLFARISRFQALVHALLSTDVSQWASMSPAVGFYDQAHMINEFRAFTGSPPTIFFRPHAGDIDPSAIQLRGRPSEWLRQPE